jgi:CubicO group peptidase (beta-lactamase class C family)
MKLLPALSPSAEVRQIRQYSNLAFILATEIVNRLSKVPFTEFVKTRIFDKLGMRNSTFTPGKNRVMGSVQDIGMREAGKAYRNRDKGGSTSGVGRGGWTGETRFYRWDLPETSAYTNNAGAGGIWTTGPDMVRLT